MDHSPSQGNLNSSADLNSTPDGFEADGDNTVQSPGDSPYLQTNDQSLHLTMLISARLALLKQAALTG